MVSEKERVLIIDDNENDYLIIKRLIGDSYDVVYDDGAGNSLASIDKYKPKCILLDYNLNGKLGIEVLNEIRYAKIYEHISIIMLTNEKDPNIVVQCIKYDAKNYLLKDDLTKDDLLLAIKNSIKETNLKIQTKKQQAEILNLLYIDELTGLNNRRYFTENIAQEIARCKRGKDIFTLSVIDLDKFKSINDTFGHDVGDKVLKIIGSTIKKHIRCTDHLCRYGGDEFILILLEMNDNSQEYIVKNHVKKSLEIIEDVNNQINKFFTKLQKEHFKSSMSIGLSIYSESIKDYNDLFKQADKAMYIMKESGGNGISCFINGEYTTHKLPL